jgi:hypothetical protein
MKGILKKIRNSPDELYKSKHEIGLEVNGNFELKPNPNWPFKIENFMTSSVRSIIHEDDRVILFETMGSIYKLESDKKLSTDEEKLVAIMGAIGSRSVYQYLLYHLGNANFNYDELDENEQDMIDSVDLENIKKIINE